MSAEFFTFEFPADDAEGYCTLDNAEGFDAAAERHGTSLAQSPPAKITMTMYADEPDKTKLADHVQSQDRLLVVSARLRAFLEGRQVSHVEYYPLEVLDHGGKVAGSEHFVAHLVDQVDCIDAEASGAKWRNQGSELQRIQLIKKLVIDPAKVPSDRQLFFPRYYAKYPIVRRELADAIKQGGFTNVDLVPIE